MSILNVFPNRETFETTNALLARIAGALDGKTTSTSTNWSEVSRNVKMGVAETMYPVGTELTSYKCYGVSREVYGTAQIGTSIDIAKFVANIGTVDRVPRVFEYDNGMWTHKGVPVNMAEYGFSVTSATTGAKVVATMTCSEITWVVRGHNHHQTSPATAHSMTLEMKNVLCHSAASLGVQLDAPEAFFSNAGSIARAAGTYSFMLSESIGSWEVGTYKFTTGVNLPVGGQFCLSGNSNTALTSLKVLVYRNGYTQYTPDEQVSITKGSGGTSLGTMGQGNVNHAERVSNGSNNYAQSAVRQFLNSSAQHGAVCERKTRFDRPPTWEYGENTGNYHGFLFGMEEDFKSALATVVVPCITNNVYEYASLDETAYAPSQTYEVRDKVFLLSRNEIYGTSDGLDDGSQLEYYVNTTNQEKRAYDNWGASRAKAMRTPSPATTGYTRHVASSGGGVSNSSDAASLGICPAIVIA